MQLKFANGTSVDVMTFWHEQMSDWLYVYLYTDDFNALIPLFTSREMTQKITIIKDDGTTEIHEDYTEVEQFFGNVKEGKLLVTVVLRKQ